MITPNTAHSDRRQRRFAAAASRSSRIRHAWRSVGRAALMAATSAGIVVVGAASGTVPAAQAAGLIDIRPATVISASAFGDIVEGGGGLDYPDDCGSINVRPHDNSRDNESNWEITSSLGIGSTVYVGTTWTVTAAIDVGIRGVGGNNGVDPLTLTFNPSGPVTDGAAPTGGTAGLNPGVSHHDGGGFTGPVAPYGKYGYTFDENSSPGLYGDGTNVRATITFKATGAGLVKSGRLDIIGHDGTPTAADIHCFVNLPDWNWNIIPSTSPIAKADTAKTDAAYASTPPSQTGGRHSILINLLGNDDDPSTPGGVGSTNDIRVVDWPAELNCGSQAQLDAVPSLANFDSLATGPCTYTPPPDADAPGFNDTPVFSYTIVQRSNLKEATSKVTIQIVPNEPPSAGAADIEMEQSTDYAEVSLVGVTNDPEDDPVTCLSDVTVSIPAVGNVAMDPDCTFAWDSQTNYTGDLVIDYTVCDQHPTLINAQMGKAVRAPDYSLNLSFPARDDLGVGATRRCTPGTVNLDIIADDLPLQVGPKALNDTDIVDQGYVSEGIGKFALRLDVLANDQLFSDPADITNFELTNSIPPSIATVTPNFGDHTFDFIPASGAGSTVNFGYRVCVQPAQVETCTTAKVSIKIRKNLAPVASPDDLGDLTKEAFVMDVSANDDEPDFEALACAPAPVSAVPAEAFASVAIDANCQLAFDPNDAYNGPATIEYRICDDHELTNPKWDAVPYGANGEQVLDPAPRCSIGIVTMNLADVVVEAPVPLPVNKPTCNADAFATPMNVELISNVLANDTDLDESGVASPLTLPLPETTDTTQGGTINVAGNQLQYLPRPGFVGVDTAVYNAIDTNGQGCSATVTYTVTGADAPPTTVTPPDPAPTMPPVAELPSTGSSSNGPMIAGMALLLAGSAMVVIGPRRRRQRS